MSVKTNVTKLLFFTCICLFYSINIFAQSSGYNVVHYTTQDGLPQNSITAISFDKAGYCWLGTEMGLVRFDGRAFKIFNAEKSEGLPLNRIRFSTTDASGNVYIRTETEQLTIDVSQPGTAPYPRVIKNPDVWVPLVNGEATVSPVMNRWFSGKMATAAQATKFNYQNYNLKSGGIYCSEGDILLYLSGEKLIRIDSISLEEDLKIFPTDNLFLLLEKGKILKAWKNGVLQKNVNIIQGPVNQNAAYQKGNFSCHTSYGQSYIYAGSTLYGIEIKNGQVYSKILLEDIHIPVASLVYYHPEQGKYYIGSLVSGLFVVTTSDFHYPASSPDAVNEGFYSQVITSAEDIICQRFLYRKDGSYKKLSLNKYVGATFFLNRQQQLYYGNEPALYRYDVATGSNQRMGNLDSRPSSFYQDKTDSNVTIISTSFSMGKLIRDSVGQLKRLPGGTAIMSTCQTGKDSFLIATQAGVKWYDFANNKIYRTVLDSLYIRNIYAESRERVWISTYGNGFYLFEKGKIYPLPDNSFPALKTIHAFVDDGRGNFWLPTNNGLFKVNKNALLAYAKDEVNEVYFYNYSVADNLRTNEFNGGCTPAYVWMKDSLLSLPSIEGIVQFYPHTLSAILPVKKIYVEEVRLNNMIVDLSATKNLVLKPDYGKLTVTVSSPYFGNKANIQLVYMTEGIDKEWQPVAANGEIVLNRIPPGKHNIIVRKLTGQGVSEYDSLVLSIEVTPWFYNTWWFYALLLIVAGGVIFAFIRIRTGILKERNRKLKEIIHVQTEDLNQTVEKLKSSEEELKQSNQMKDRVTTMVLHDLRSPIRFLHVISNQLAKRYKTMPDEDVEKNLSVLNAGTASLNDFTEQFFAWAAIQHKDFKIKEEDFLLQDLLKELQDLYNDITTINNNKLIVVSTGIVIYTDKNILSALLRNLLDNANKNTRDGNITIGAKKEGSKIIISVTDTGSGLTPEMINNFHNPEKNPGRNGNGSIIVINLLEKIGGKLTVESLTGKGATFYIELNDHLSARNDEPADQAPAMI